MLSLMSSVSCETFLESGGGANPLLSVWNLLLHTRELLLHKDKPDRRLSLCQRVYAPFV